MAPHQYNSTILLGWRVVLLVGILLLLSVLGLSVDDRLLNDISVWMKPLKFNFSFALHLATLLIFVQFLRDELQNSIRMKWNLCFLYGAVIAELSYIFIQAFRGRHSHFNFDTHLETIAYYGLMGGAAVVVMVCTFIIGCYAYLEYRDDKKSGFKIGATIGATVGSIATLITAGVLASGAVTSTGHWVGGELSDANGLPLFGWSTTGGDLRVPHFFATHMIQALPLIGFASDKLLPKHSVRLVVISALGSLVIVWITFLQALSGSPFLVFL